MLDTQERRWTKNTCGRDELVETNIGYHKNPKNKKWSHQREARTKRDNGTKNTDETANMVRTWHKNEDNTDSKYGVSLQHRGKPNQGKTKKTVDRQCQAWPRRKKNIKMAEALEMVRDRREWRRFTHPHRRSSVDSWWENRKDGILPEIFDVLTFFNKTHFTPGKGRQSCAANSIASHIFWRTRDHYHTI